MTDAARPTVPRLGGPRGPFDTDAYVSACARHAGAEAILLCARDAALWLLRSEDGALGTVYGYPRPLGDSSAAGLLALADELAGLRAPLTVALSPLGAGRRLAELLHERLPVLHTREVWVADLDRDVLDGFSAGARAKIRRALRGGAGAEVGPVRGEFGAHYRAAMDEFEADAVYRFDDTYFEAIPRSDAFQVTVSDEHGVSAAALFLCRELDASYHLSARRRRPPSLPGAANLAVLEGLRECARRGARTCVLGGGLTPSAADALFRFKAGMATVALPRPTFATSDARR